MHPSSQLIAHTPERQLAITVDHQARGRLVTGWLRRADLPLNTRCGQRGLCDGCLIELVAGTLLHADSGQTVDASAGPQTLQACQYCPIPETGAVIHVPARSLLAHRPQVVTSFRVDVSRAHDPLWQTVEIPAAEFAEADDPIAAVCEAVQHRRGGRTIGQGQSVDASEPAPQPQSLTMEFAQEVNPVIEAGDGLAEFLARTEPVARFALDQRGDRWCVLPNDDDEQPSYGVAIDVGTTTVVVMLVDLDNGRILNTSAALNGQARLGDNVLTRINLCMQKPELVERLQHAVARRTIQPLLAELLTESRVSLDQVKCMAIAGNTTMLHLLAGVDPTPLGTAPFTPVFIEHRVLPGRSLGLLPKPPGRSQAALSTGHRTIREADRCNPTVHLLPAAAAYLGADVIAGVFSTGMAYRDHPCLLVDVGTNGEIVLKHGNRFLGCATAAGPAFEGAGLTSGVRAGQGAVSHIRLDLDTADPEIEVIGDTSPIGICGTAYVDFIAEARQCGLIGPTGRFSDRFTGHPRLVQHANGRGFEIAKPANEKTVVITEGDIASLLQAKAAIAAGIVCLLRRAALNAEDLATLYLAGGFGFHMNVASVLRCGLLPGFRQEQIELVGNSSLAGAFLAMMDSGVLAEMKHIASQLETVELNLEPDFESIYIDQLGLG
ncbi:MAG: DUF4445 domain-containing protein [Pirellulaceae bacterium]|nr:DUF4445 domain-containing protein [Pirellulaceae bacterium]